jgi:hypothetical protein
MAGHFTEFQAVIDGLFGDGDDVPAALAESTTTGPAAGRCAGGIFTGGAWSAACDQPVNESSFTSRGRKFCTRCAGQRFPISAAGRR